MSDVLRVAGRSVGGRVQGWLVAKAMESLCRGFCLEEFAEWEAVDEVKDFYLPVSFAMNMGRLTRRLAR